MAAPPPRPEPTVAVADIPPVDHRPRRLQGRRLPVPVPAIRSRLADAQLLTTPSLLVLDLIDKLGEASPSDVKVEAARAMRNSPKEWVSC
ncbi:hypothetical protein [Streptomyces decoyicus]